MTSSFPDTPAQSSLGTIRGSVFGGEAPIVGAELFILQAGTAYNGPSTNLLTNAADAQGNDPAANRGNYILTGAGGSFSISGDYTCSANYPVYIATLGGVTTGTGSAVLQITATSYLSGIVTFVASNALTGSSTVAFANGAFTTASGYSALNGKTMAVTGATPTTFSISFKPTVTTAGPTGYAIALGANGVYNPAIANMAVLGLCPSTGNFANVLQYVYINEVSTVAAAYSLAGFGTGPFTIGGPAVNSVAPASLSGIQNAAQTAGQLYNINSGGVALSNTNQGLNNTTSSGVVPQKEINTLANILSACVDSTNTANSSSAPNTTGASSQCYTLFENASNTGVPYSKSTAGPFPTDTVTAAFNIAQYPAAAPGALFTVQSAGETPFLPDLNSAPSDFSITITYSGGGIGETNGNSPHSIAVDAAGNIYTLNYSANLLNILSPLGVPANASGYGSGTLNGPDGIAVDSTSSNVWIANGGSSNVSDFRISNGTTANFSAGSNYTNLQDVAIDGSGNIWVGSDAANHNATIELNSSGGSPTAFTAYSPQGIAIQKGATGNVWVTDQATQGSSYYDYVGNEYGYGGNTTNGSITDPIGIAIDSKGYVWFANSNGTVSAISNNRAKLTGSPFKTGTATSSNDGIAIDGSNVIWITNPKAGALYELSNAGSALTPTAGYSATSPDGIAIDPSGNVWYNSSGAAAVFEVVGAATPVVTPIANAVSNSELGTEP